MFGWGFMIWWYKDNDAHVVLIYIFFMIMMLYAYDEYDMCRDYDVMIWGILTSYSLIMWWYVFDVHMLML